VIGYEPYVMPRWVYVFLHLLCPLFFPLLVDLLIFISEFSLCWNTLLEQAKWTEGDCDFKKFRLFSNSQELIIPRDSNRYRRLQHSIWYFC
jgi:hypothetical protein